MIIEKKIKKWKQVSSKSFLEDRFQYDKSDLDKFFCLEECNVISLLHKPSWNSLADNISIQKSKWKYLWSERSMWLGNHVHLGKYFPTHKELGFSGKFTSFLVKNILEVISNRGLDIWYLSPCVLGSISGVQEPTGSCRTHASFPKVMKILKFLKLSKNSRLVSPVLGFLDFSQSPVHPWFST